MAIVAGGAGFGGSMNHDDIYLISADGTQVSALTNDDERDQDPVWSPDGTRIVYSQEGVLFVMNADGTNRTQLTSPSEVDGYDYAPAWSPDGHAVVFNRHYVLGGFRDDVRTIPLSGGVPFASSLVASGTNPSWRPR
jgi:TolB protein